MAMTSLNTLKLNLNQIEELSDYSFNGLNVSLKILELYSNSIQIISSEVLSFLAVLEHLDFSQNEMNSL